MRRLPCNKIYFQLKDELPHLGNCAFYSYGNTKASSSIFVQHWLLTHWLAVLGVWGWSEKGELEEKKSVNITLMTARTPAGLLKALQTPSAVVDGMIGFTSVQKTSLISGESDLAGPGN